MQKVVQSFPKVGSVKLKAFVQSPYRPNAQAPPEVSPKWVELE